MKRQLIDGDWFNKNWMSDYYEHAKIEVTKLNRFVPERHKIKMEKNFEVVKTALQKAADDCGLRRSDVQKIFLVAMRWVEPLNMRALRTRDLSDKTDKERSLSIGSLAQEERLLKQKEDDLLGLRNRIARKKGNSGELSFLIEEIKILRWSIDNKKDSLRSGKVGSVKIKVMTDLEKLLSSNLTGRGSKKTARISAGELLETIYCLPKPKTGWDKVVATATSNKKPKRSSTKKK